MLKSALYEAPLCKLATASRGPEGVLNKNGIPATRTPSPDLTKNVSGNNVLMYMANANAATTKPDVKKHVHLMIFSIGSPPDTHRLFGAFAHNEPFSFFSMSRKRRFNHPVGLSSNHALVCFSEKSLP